MTVWLVIIALWIAAAVACWTLVVAAKRADETLWRWREAERMREIAQYRQVYRASRLRRETP
jgi:hypothetical protein